MRVEIARALRELRERKLVTQADLAARLGVQQSFISKYEAAERKLDMVDVRAICLALDTSLAAFASALEKRWSAER